MENRRYIIIGCAVFIAFCIACGYYVGQQSTSRDADIQRVQTVERQLNNAGAELDEATRTNQSARNTVADGVIVNERIDASIDRSASAVERSESANSRTGAAITDAQHIVSDAKRTADENAKLIADSQRIIERAAERTARAEECGEAK